jgi:hypothetical protein
MSKIRAVTSTALVGRSSAAADNDYFESKPTGKIPLQMLFANRSSLLANVTVVNLLLYRNEDKKIFVRLANRHSVIGAAKIDNGDGFEYRFIVKRVAGYTASNPAYPRSASVRLDVVGWKASSISASR